MGVERFCEWGGDSNERKTPDSFPGRFNGQATKGVRRMPWRKQAMKDVVNCDKPRGAVSKL